MKKLNLLSVLLCLLLVSGRMWAECDTIKSVTSFVLCEADLPYTYIGAKSFIIHGDTTILDTVTDGAASGCDSIAKVSFMINRVDTIAQDTFICDGNFIQCEWRGKQITKADSTYFDTVRYAAPVCDSVIYVLNVKSANKQTSTVFDTLCLSAAKSKYPRLKIAASGVYVDTIPCKITQCDSIITYNICLLSKPVLPKLVDFSEDLLPVICSDTLKPDKLIEAVTAAAEDQPKGVAHFGKIWLEVRMDPKSTFVKANGAVVASADSVEFRLAGTSECDAKDPIYDSIVKRFVEIPTPENLPVLGTMPAVKKYGNWLLAIHYNQIKDKGYKFDNNNVTWYRVVGSVDPVLGITDDEKVGEGYYYTADKSLTSQYYAIIQDTMDCGTILRTCVLDCAPAQSMTLAPLAVRRGAEMTLSQINPEVSTQIAIYDMQGKLIRSMMIECVDTYQLRVDQNEGMYFLRAVNGDAEATFKYLVTQ